MVISNFGIKMRHKIEMPVYACAAEMNCISWSLILHTCLNIDKHRAMLKRIGNTRGKLKFGVKNQTERRNMIMIELYTVFHENNPFYFHCIFAKLWTIFIEIIQCVRYRKCVCFYYEKLLHVQYIYSLQTNIYYLVTVKSRQNTEHSTVLN